jgi:hypothetical protein
MNKRKSFQELVLRKRTYINKEKKINPYFKLYRKINSEHIIGIKLKDKNTAFIR